MIEIESIELENYRTFSGRTSIELPAGSEHVMVFLRRPQGRSTIMRAMSWCLYGSEVRSFLARGGTDVNLPNFDVSASQDEVEVQVAVVLRDRGKSVRFERSSIFHPPDLAQPVASSWKYGNGSQVTERTVQEFMEQRNALIPDLVTGVNLWDLDFIRMLDIPLVNDHIVRTVKDTRGSLVREERDRIEASMTTIMQRCFGLDHWNPTISATGLVKRVQMNWSAAMMFSAWSDFRKSLLYLVPALALLDVYGQGVPIVTKVSHPETLRKIWTELDDLFPTSQKVAILPARLYGTMEMLPLMAGRTHSSVVT